MKIIKSNNLLQKATLIAICGFLCFLQCFGQRRNSEDALLIARRFAIQKGSYEIRLMLCSSDILKRSKSLGESFYIYKTRSVGSGFVIISGDKRLPDILAFSDNENFDTESIPENVKYWLSCYDRIFLDSMKNAQGKMTIDGVRSEGVSPILGDILWGQGSPFNLQCPMYNGSQCVTGCVATAMAMVMKHYQYPSCGTGYINYTTASHHINVSRNLAEHPLLWESMNSQYDNSATFEQKTAVANLMVGCGVAVRMDYAPDGSGAYQYDMLRAYIENFGYDDDASFLLRDFYSTATWHSLLVKELNEGRPVNYAGSNNSDGGHSFIIDGYQISGNESSPYYHLNWGWNGRCDGYYYLADLHPKDKSMPYTTRAFSQGQQMLIGIKPQDNVRLNNRTLCTDDVNIYPLSVKPGHRFTLSVSNIYNLSYLPFTGKVYILLLDEDNSQIIGSKAVNNLDFLTGTNRITIECHTPEGLKEGKYGIVLKGGINEHELFDINMPNTISITVGENADDNSILKNATLCTSEIEAFQRDEDAAMINLRVYEMFNYSEETFTGTIQPIIKNRNNKIVSLLPDTIFLNEMLSRDMLDTPVVFSFNVPDSLEAGAYKLFIGVIDANTNVYNDIMFYDCVSNEEPSEYYLDMIIFDNEVRIGNHVFQRYPTVVESLPYVDKTAKQVFSLLGSKRNRLQKGVNIIGKKKVVIK